MTDDYTEPDIAQKTERVKEFIKNSEISKKAAIYKYIQSLPDSAEVDSYVEQYLAQVTRADIEAQVSQNYAESMGIDASSVMSYISQMTDEEIFGFAADAIAEQYSAQYAAMAEQKLASMTIEQLAAALDVTEFTDAQYENLFFEYAPDRFSQSDYDGVLEELGYADYNNPESVKIYAKTFRDKDNISESITDYNNSVPENDKIKYTDYVALLMSSITDIISGISYLLIAFVGISLVVSSIMIGIITYISVLERTREIGILRAIGASKGDISTVFNAETLIVGLVSGMIGIGISLLLIIPINAIVYSLTGIAGLKAALPPAAAVILVIIGMILTLIAGLIPSRVASKRDPVEALRTV